MCPPKVKFENLRDGWMSKSRQWQKDHVGLRTHFYLWCPKPFSFFFHHQHPRDVQVWLGGVHHTGASIQQCEGAPTDGCFCPQPWLLQLPGHDRRSLQVLKAKERLSAVGHRRWRRLGEGVVPVTQAAVGAAHLPGPPQTAGVLLFLRAGRGHSLDRGNSSGLQRRRGGSWIKGQGGSVRLWLSGCGPIILLVPFCRNLGNQINKGSSLIITLAFRINGFSTINEIGNSHYYSNLLHLTLYWTLTHYLHPLPIVHFM